MNRLYAVFYKLKWSGDETIKVLLPASSIIHALGIFDGMMMNVNANAHKANVCEYRVVACEEYHATNEALEKGWQR